MKDHMLHILKEHLSAKDYRHLMSATDEGRRFPFGSGREHVLEALLIQADDPTVDLLMKCEHILTVHALHDPTPEDPPPEARLFFEFEQDAPELPHFLGTLRQNGFATAAVEGETVTVWVYIDAASDHDFYRKKEMVRSFWEMTKLAKGRLLGGHRLY